MVDKIFEERSIIKNSLVKETCKCDVCNKTIYEKLYDEKEKPVIGKKYNLISYFTLETGCDGSGCGHYSEENEDICSKKCLGERFLEYIGTKDKRGDCDDKFTGAYFNVTSVNIGIYKN